jgi:hypothetical protein
MVGHPAEVRIVVMGSSLRDSASNLTVSRIMDFRTPRDTVRDTVACPTVSDEWDTVKHALTWGNFRDALTVSERVPLRDTLIP